mgnify:CR=1 FL=1
MKPDKPLVLSRERAEEWNASIRRLFRGEMMVATTAYHLLGDVSRQTPTVCYVYGETDRDWVGNWLDGLGFKRVKFPKQTTRQLTPDEQRLGWSSLPNRHIEEIDNVA